MPRNAISRRDPARRARALKRWVASILVLPAILVFGIVNASSAAAQWRTNAVASVTVKSGTLASPVGVSVPGSAWFSVPVSWSPGTGTVVPDGYFVTRTSGSTTTAACGSSPSSLMRATSCTDSWLPTGTYTYVVTAAYRSWTSASPPSSKVSVRGLFGFDFVDQPATVDTNGAMGTTVAIQLLDDSGSSAKVAGVPVTVGLEANSADNTTQDVGGTGSLAPVAAALVMDGLAADSGGGSAEVLATTETDARGIATFEALSVDAAPGDYVLTAASPGLETATSEPFTVQADSDPSPTPSATPSLPGSRDTSTYSVLALRDVTSTGTTTVSGDVGAGGTVSGLDTGSIKGELRVGDVTAGALDALADDIARQAAKDPGKELADPLVDATLTRGIHRRSGTLDLSGSLTLDAAGNPDATFVIQAQDLKAAAGTTVRLANGAKASHVTWVVSGDVNVGAGSSLSGTVLARGSIVVDKGTTLFGQALSQASVTLTGATIANFADAPIFIDPGTPTDEPQVDPTPISEPTASVGPSAEASSSPSPTPTGPVTAPAPEEKTEQAVEKKSQPGPSTPPEPPVPAATPDPAKTTEAPAPEQTQAAEPTDE
jgi:hypothetical protein